MDCIPRHIGNKILSKHLRIEYDQPVTSLHTHILRHILFIHVEECAVGHSN